MKDEIEIYYADISTAIEIPFFRNGLSAGFPSAGEAYKAESIDLNQVLIKHPESTFLGVVEGDSMEDERLFDGDVVIIDRSLKVKEDYKILCCIDGQYTIKFIERDKKNKEVIWLIPGNKKYKPIKVTSESNFIVWGIVVHSITTHVGKII